MELTTADDASAVSRLSRAGFRTAGNGKVVVFTDDAEAQVARLVDAAGVPVSNVHVHRPTLDDVFLHFGTPDPGRPPRARRAHAGARAGSPPVRSR